MFIGFSGYAFNVSRASCNESSFIPHIGNLCLLSFFSCLTWLEVDQFFDLFKEPAFGFIIIIF